MPKTYIRFNYFQVRLEGELNGETYSAPWDMRNLLNYLSVRRNQLDCVINVGEYNAELDRTTFITDDEPFISFQITKLRDNKIPYIKVIDNEPVPLVLAENQYLGEYITVVFDPNFLTVGVQSNLFSLNIKQLENFLTEIRNRYRVIINRPIDNLNVTLNPMIDDRKVQQIRDSEIFRQITIKATPHQLMAFQEAQTLNRVSAAIDQVGGATFEINISLGNAPKEQSLNQEIIQEIIDEFNRIPQTERAKITVKARPNLDEDIEVVNLLDPRITNVISFEVQNRTAIGHQTIHTNFMEEYENIQATIQGVLVQLNI